MYISFMLLRRGESAILGTLGSQDQKETRAPRDPLVNQEIVDPVVSLVSRAQPAKQVLLERG